MRNPSTRVSLFLAATLLLALPARADGVRDNDPGHVRPVPAVGIPVPEAERKVLEEGLHQLRKALSNLRPKGELHAPGADLKAWDLYADVAIYQRAVEVALQDREFFNAKEIQAAKQLLMVGIERSSALAEKKSPWRFESGLVVRGYMSQIDGTPQPYGLVIPKSRAFLEDQPMRLDLWLHGRGETLTELNFIRQRQSDPRPISPENTIVLHPYGRFCNANKFAGEIDPLEALAAAQRNYAVDSHRIAVRGFSMGGAACWQLAVHHPSKWFAATPGAGFSETPEFLKSFQKETLNPPWWEHKLWRWYDCPGYVTNLKNLPVIAYSGEEDIQKQAADVMEAAYAKQGMKLLHLIGPKTKHSIHPDSAKEIESRLEKLAAEQLPKPLPEHLEFTTYTLIYPSAGWVTLQAMKEQWEPATVMLDHRQGRDVRVTTKNVHSLDLDFARISKDVPPSEITLDGQKLPLRQGRSSKRYAFMLVEGRWIQGVVSDSRPLHLPFGKNPQTCGPIDHAFMSSFIFVKPSGKCAHPAVQKWVDAELQRAITQWRRQFRGDARVKLDTEITDEDIHTSNLILWGDPTANQLIKTLASRLPIPWTDKSISLGDKPYDAAQHALIAIIPNSKNPKKYIVLNSGFTYREYDYLNNARQTPKLPDWAIIDLRTPPGSQWPGKVVAADFFDESWQLKPPRPAP